MSFYRSRDLAEALERNSEPDLMGGCRFWTGQMTNMGYGRISVKNRKRYVHRLSFELAIGVIPKGMCVCHRCDRPLCLNPAHLFLGTQAENLADMASKGRARDSAGTKNPRKIKATDIPTIRARLSAGETNRAIANTYGVSPGTIRNIRAGHSWRRLAAQALAANDDSDLEIAA